MKQRLRWSLFFAAFNLFLLAEPLTLFWLAEGATAASLLLAYVMAVTATVLVILYPLGAVRNTLWAILVSVFAALSVLTLKLLYFGAFSQLSPTWLALIAMALVPAAYALMKAFDKPSITLYASCVMVLVVFPLGLKYELIMDAATESSLTAREEGFLKQLSRVKLNDRPNIYYLSFDSMVPPKSAREFLGISRLGYHEVVKKHFQVLNPSAVLYPFTKGSLNSTMRLDQSQLAPTINYFNGAKESALGAVLSNNGYEITTGFPSNYFGSKGPFIDRYVVRKREALEATVLCIDAGASLMHRLRNFGACGLVGNFHGLGDLFPWATSPVQTFYWHKHLRKQILRAAKSAVPQFVALHTYRPIGHTRSDYNHAVEAHRDRYRAVFMAGDEQLRILLERLIPILRKHDPRSVVIVAGDHGIKVSRRVRYEEDPDFFVQDRHLIYLAVMSGTHRCSKKAALAKYSSDFYTPGRVLAAVISCLATDSVEQPQWSFEQSEEISSYLERNMP